MAAIDANAATATAFCQTPSNEVGGASLTGGRGRGRDTPWPNAGILWLEIADTMNFLFARAHGLHDLQCDTQPGPRPFRKFAAIRSDKLPACPPTMRGLTLNREGLVAQP